MGDVNVYERPPSADEKKKKMSVYMIFGAFVLLIAIIVVGLFVYDAPSFGNEGVGDKAATETGTPVTP